MNELAAEVAAIRAHRELTHQPCCVTHPDGTRSRCDVDTLLAYIDEPIKVKVNVSASTVTHQKEIP